MSRRTWCGTVPICYLVRRLAGGKAKSDKEYFFDKVLGPACSQAKVFADCEVPFLVDKVAEGYHATIFAYGQTGAGKTYTMEGYSYTLGRDKTTPKPIIEKGDNWGVIPRAISYLFARVSAEAEKTRRKYTIYCSFLQIYNERIFDLLNPAHFAEGDSAAAGLKLRFKNDNFVVDNLYTFECKTEKDVYDLFHFGLNNRVVATHRLNHASSRSHSLLTLTVESVDLNNPVSPVRKYRVVGRLHSEQTAAGGPGGVGAHERFRAQSQAGEGVHRDKQVAVHAAQSDHDADRGASNGQVGLRPLPRVQAHLSPSSEHRRQQLFAHDFVAESERPLLRGERQHAQLLDEGGIHRKQAGEEPGPQGQTHIRAEGIPHNKAYLELRGR